MMAEVWKPNPDCNYINDYYAAFDLIKEGQDERAVFKWLILTDLYFIIQFVMEIPPYDVKGRPFCNHPFVVQACRDVQKRPDEDWSLDLWFRGGFKSTILNKARTLQRILKYPERCTCVASHTRPNAKQLFVIPVAQLMERNLMLKSCFPDILWENVRDAPKWSLAINTPVLTVNGWKNHGDLEVGDKIFGSKGQVITVTGTSGTIENAECRKVVFDDCEIVASSEHLWPVQQRKSTHQRQTWLKNPEIKIVATDELPINDKSKRLPLTPKVHSPGIGTQLLDPYILGLWLGDGTAGTNIISMASEDEYEILDQINKAGFEYYIHRKKEEDNFAMYGVRGLKEILSSLGCLINKHIPEVYLHGTGEEKLSLLQGLMDSDGTCKGHSTSRGMCTFSNTNKTLADGVFFLTTSLGLRPNLYSFQPKPVNNKRANHVSFVGIKSTPPFRLARKLNKCKEKRHQLGRYVRAIEKINTVPVNCIKVDAEDHLYLAGKSMVVTHNSEDEGYTVKRASSSRSEPTLSAHGVIEGMPIGSHFDYLVLDDLETQEDVRNPKVVLKIRDTFDILEDLLTRGGKVEVIGTPYSHMGVYVPFIVDKKNADGEPAFKYTRIPATKDGTLDGEPIFHSVEELQNIRARKGMYSYLCQQMIDPSPVGARKLESRMLVRYERKDIPYGLYKFIVIDPAGAEETLTSENTDPWAMLCIGVEPSKDDLGASRVFILDAAIETMRSENVPTTIAGFYMRNGLINQLGIEITGQFSFHYIKNILQQEHHIWLSEDMGNLVYLKPKARNKETKIEESIAFPLYQGKIGYLDSIPERYMEIIRQEIDLFPFYHPNAIDALAYFYADMLPAYDFMFVGREDRDVVIPMSDYEPLRYGMARA
jgi:hypothetical protein